MRFYNSKQLKRLLQRHGVYSKKSLGQHFLISESIIRRIYDSLEGFAGILEIGPGPGVLTAALSDRANKMIAIEIDRSLQPVLTESAPKAELIFADVLKVDLPKQLAGLPEPRAVVSNMPYQITGPLLTKIAESREFFSCAVLMMQREVGEKILAQPGNRNFGSLSVFLQAQFNVQKLVLVKPVAFLPPPRVDSIVLKLIPKETGLTCNQEKLFFRLVEKGFSQPRKTLVNNMLGNHFMTREQCEQILVRLGLALDIRPHQIDIERWKSLAEQIYSE